jgi:hypothetical protein
MSKNQSATTTNTKNFSDAWVFPPMRYATTKTHTTTIHEVFPPSFSLMLTYLKSAPKHKKFMNEMRTELKWRIHLCVCARAQTQIPRDLLKNEHVKKEKYIDKMLTKQKLLENPKSHQGKSMKHGEKNT